MDFHETRYCEVLLKFVNGDFIKILVVFFCGCSKQKVATLKTVMKIRK